MGARTNIPWCDATVNDWWGCDKVHSGCKNCFAAELAGRFGVEWGASVPRRYIGGWRKTLAKVAARAKREGRRLRVFFRDMSDLFDAHAGAVVDSVRRPLWTHKDTRLVTARVTHLPPASVRPLRIADLRRQVFVAIDEYADWLDAILVTKRPANVATMWDNVLLLYSASDQESLEPSMDDVVCCAPLCPIGLSLEPLVGPVDLTPWAHDLQWVIVGGESGPQARPCRVEWVRSLVRQCAQAGLRCFVKQMGALCLDDDPASRCGWPSGTEFCDRTEGCQVCLAGKGEDPGTWPVEFNVRQYPERPAAAPAAVANQQELAR